MRRIAGVSGALVFCGAVCLSAQTPAPGPGAVVPGTPPQVRTSATVTRSVPPDLAVVTIELAGQGSSALLATRAVAGRVDAVRNALVRLGIPEDSVMTRGASPWYYWWNRIEAVLRYDEKTHRSDSVYTARDNLVAHVRDLTLLRRLPEVALAAGAERVNEIQFQATRTAAPQEAALEEAARQARHNAEILAVAMGGALGRLIEITTEAESRPWHDLPVIGLASARNAPTTVNPTPVQLNATVHGRWEFVPGH